MASVSIENLISTNFSNHQKSVNDEEYQRQKNDAPLLDTTAGNAGKNVSIPTSSSFASESLRQQILAQMMNAKGEEVAVDTVQIQNEISTTLEYIVGATLANIVQQKTASLSAFKSSPIYDSAMMILDLVSHFVCSEGDGTLATEVLEFMGKFASVELECVRALVCEFMGWSIQYLYSGGGNASVRINKSKNKLKRANVPFLTGCSTQEEEFEWREECTALIKSFLVERLQDKSQAVRQIAIKSCGYLYTKSHKSSSGTNDLDLDNPELHDEITQALLWNISHDPSFANRSTALQNIPIVIDTIPAIVERVRDAKLKVRVDALNVLTTKVSMDQLSNEQRANILRDGLSTRYPATYAATTKMLCCGWMKSTKFDPVALLDLLDPVQHESVCLNAAKAIIVTASNDYEMEGVLTTSEVTLGELSQPEVREYKEKVLSAISITNPKIGGGDESCEITPASIIFIKARCELILENTKTLNEYKKSTRLAEIITDVTVLGQVIGTHLKELNQIMEEKYSLEDEDDDDDDGIMAGYDQREDTEVFICLHLLKLSKFVDLKEEGSRRHFSSVIHRILCDPSTHEDLVEGAVHALSASHDDEASFLLSISEILASVIETEGGYGSDAEDGNRDNTVSHARIHNEEKMEQYLRGIEILSVALERTSRKMSSNAILQNFNTVILNAITSPSLGPLVREAGVSCLGRYVILMDEEAIINTFKPLLMGIAFGEDEKIEIRAQALLAITDLAFMFHRFLAPIVLQNSDQEEVTVTDLVLKMLCQPKKSLNIVAAECAAKLLLNGKIHDANIVAHLVAMYFDKNLTLDVNEEDDAVKEVGSPTRLVQMLTIFFPAYSMASSIGRDTLTLCIKQLLKIVQDRSSIKVKGRRSSVLPITKMIEYICQTLENGEDAAAKETSDAERSGGTFTGASPILNIAVAISDFLCVESDNLSTPYLRSLCQILKKSYIDIESEDIAILQRLKTNLEELSMKITDNSAMGSLEVMIELLDDLQSDEEDEVPAENESGGEEESSDDSTVESSDGECKNKMMGEDRPDIGNRNLKRATSSSEKPYNIPLFATAGFSNEPDQNSTSLKERSRESRKTRKTRKAEIPLFATLGSNDGELSLGDSASGSSDGDSMSNYDSDQTFE